MLIAIYTSQLLGTVGRDMFHFRLRAIVMTSFCTNPTACAGFQRSFKRLVELGFKSLKSNFNCLSHYILTLPLEGVETLRAVQRTFQRRYARRRNISSDGSFREGY